MNAIAAMSAIVTFDFLVQRRVRDPKTRWFLLHATANFYVCLLSAPSIMRVMRDPINAMNIAVHKTPSTQPIQIVVLLHTYHCLGFALSRREVLHHSLFLPTLGIPALFYNWGELCNFLCFFVCGLPGGITYFILAIQRCQMIKDVNEKKITAKLHVWCRCPGILYGAFCGLQAYTYSKHSVPIWALLLQVFMPINGLYYMEESIQRYIIHL
jgi:hypothetical protein